MSSEYYFDKLNFYVDDALTAQISGKSVTWSSLTNTIADDGAHTFKWEYAKDADTAVGQDCAWIADVVWAPRSALTVVGGSGDGDYTNGQAIVISADVQAGKTFYRWTGVGAWGATNSASRFFRVRGSMP